ncbi:MAG: hypothetical protein LWX56_09485 [Ignavibacteria bacterium]|nr:hypothetical protein [Ignavibacteria bacterium]
MKNFVLSLLCITLMYGFSAFAQSVDSASGTGESTDTSSSSHGFMHKMSKHATKKTKKDKWHKFHWDDDDMDLTVSGDPFIELNYGISGLNHNELSQNFNKSGEVGMKLGSVDIDYEYNGTKIIEQEKCFVLFGIHNKDFYKENDQAKITGKIIQLGVGLDRALAYGDKRSFIAFSNGWGVAWSKLQLDQQPLLQKDFDYLSDYNETFRFGIRSEGGINYQPFPYLSLNATFERNTVYNRVLFWRAGGSVVAEIIGHSLLDKFIDRVLDTTPSVAPILNFLLQNGLSYGMSELRKSEMNFPFGGDSPLMYSTVKLGFSFTF